jgi:hypothetical protein
MKRLLLSFALVASLATPALAQVAASAQGQPTLPVQTPQAGQRGGRGQAAAAPAAPTATPGAMTPTMDYRVNMANPVNVKLELAITDTYAGTPAKKTVTLLIANGGGGMIRTSNRLPDGSPVNLNVDCQVTVNAVTMPGRERGPDVIRASLTFAYTPAQSPQAEGRPAPRPADLTESVTVILQDGKTTVVSQSADPATDRKVTVEVTATIIK